MARSRFAVMTMTDAAAERARDLVANAGRPVIGLRVGVKNGGCAGMSYTVEFAEGRQPFDEVIEDKGVTILVDSKALMFLLGTQLDFETTKLAATFTFKNPNQISACGCGESVAIKPAMMPDAAEASHA